MAKLIVLFFSITLSFNYCMKDEFDYNKYDRLKYTNEKRYLNDYEIQKLFENNTAFPLNSHQKFDCLINNKPGTLIIDSHDGKITGFFKYKNLKVKTLLKGKYITNETIILKDQIHGSKYINYYYKFDLIHSKYLVGNSSKGGGKKGFFIKGKLVFD